jgi:beta-1,4-mannosyltransferase
MTRVLVVPRDANPYQELLYDQLRRRGLDVDYLEGGTPSQSLNLLLMPALLARQRLRGARLLHLHWVYTFAVPAARWVPVLRRAAQLWFALVLVVAKALGYRIVWTAHNALPHERTFHDDREARLTLVRKADAVILHSDSAGVQLAALGMRPRLSRTIPHGSYHGAYPSDVTREQARSRLGVAEHDRALLFFGRVAEHKGVEQLVEAFARTCPSPAGPLRLLVAGACADTQLADRLRRAAACSGRVQLHLEHVPDDEVQVWMRAADIAVIPLRALTTSGSVLLARSFGLPVLLPDVDALPQGGDAAFQRYQPTMAGLTDALRGLASLSPTGWQQLATAAADQTDLHSWADVADQTLALYEELL